MPDRFRLRRGGVLRLVRIRENRVRPVNEAGVDGSNGSIDSDANFAPAKRADLPASRLQWEGSSFFTPGCETWCTLTAIGVSVPP